VPLVVAAAALVGASRVVLGVHWTSDVVSGWLLGVAVVLAASALAPPYGGRPERGARPEPESGGRNPSPPRPADHR